MALHIDLQNIVSNKPAGDYFIYYDRSVVPELVSASGLRILVGQSKQGVVNTLTYHDKWDSFKQVYGDVDRSIMRNGSYFHRSAFSMLSIGTPIGAINLRPFDDTKDLAGKIEFSATSDNNNNAPKSVKYTSLFDRERFWKVNPTNIVDNTELNNLLTLANVGSSKVSVFIRKALDAGVDGTFEDYYANTLNKSLPDNIYKLDKVADTFVDVFVFNNDFSDLSTNQSNPRYGSLFDENGVVKSTTQTLTESSDGLGQLSQISASGFVKKYTGSLISDLTDASNNSLSIVNQINQDFTTVGLVAGINEEIVDNVARWTPTVDENDNAVIASNGSKKDLAVDLVGHNLWSTTASGNIDTEGYVGQVVNSFSYDGLITTNIKKIDYNNIKLEDFVSNNENTAIELNNVWLYGKHGVDAEGSKTYEIGDESKAYLLGLQPIKVGQKYVSKDSNLATITSLTHKGTKKIIVGLHTSAIPLQSDGTVFPTDADGKFIYPVGDDNAGELVEFHPESDEPLTEPVSNPENIVSNPENIVSNPENITAISLPVLTQVQRDDILAKYGTAIPVYLAQFDKPIATQANNTLLSSVGLENQTIVLDDSTELQIYQNDRASIFYQKDFSEIVSSFKPFVLKSYKPRKEQFVNGTSARQLEILNVLSSTLKNALVDRERVDFRYLVDGFASYIDNNLKENFTSVIKDRGVGASIINAPSIKEFKNSTNPYFKATTDGVFDASYIYQGGNLELPYTQTFSLASKGSNHGYYYAPWFIIDDNGTDLTFPPAPLVSNNYVNKSNSGRPYDAVFGIDTGVVSGTGIKSVEYDFTDADRLALEKTGINPIMFKRSAGNVIMGNRTGSRVNTALKFANVNELIIQIYEQMRPIALFLVGKLNTDQNRLVAKTRMDSVMRSILAQGAVQYYENIVSSDNNTQDVISEGLAVMDTVIVPSYANEKVVHRLIINRTTEEVTSTIL